MTVANAITFKLAGEGDDLRVINSFKAMLIELEELGHDVLPTDYNVSFFWEHVFEPEIRSGKHGIVLAIDDHECIGALFIVPERTRINTPKGRTIEYGIWIRPDHRRNGLSIELQQFGQQRLREFGFNQILSNVISNNVAGLASCRKAGAKIIGVVTAVSI